MINTEHVFQRLDLGSSRLTAVQKIREAVVNATSPKSKAIAIIKDILGIERQYSSVEKARLVAMAVGEEAFKANHSIGDVDEFIAMCEKRIDAFMSDPNNAFHFAKPQDAEVTTETVVEGIDVKVAVKADGKIKKGGKEILALELYKKHVLEAQKALTNQEFIAILMRDLNMSKAGATTYAWNVDKKMGSKLIKKRRGK